MTMWLMWRPGGNPPQWLPTANSPATLFRQLLTVRINTIIEILSDSQ